MSLAGGLSGGGGRATAWQPFAIQPDMQIDFDRSTPIGVVDGTQFSGLDTLLDEAGATFTRATAALDVGADGAPLAYGSGEPRIARDTISRAVHGVRIERGIAAAAAYTINTNNATSTANSAANIDGSTTATTVTSTGTGGFDQSFFSVSTSRWMTICVDTPKDGNAVQATVALVLSDGAATKIRTCYFRPDTGDFYSSHSDAICEVELLETPSGSWWRVWMTTYNPDHTTAIIRFQPIYGGMGTRVRGPSMIFDSPNALSTTKTTNASVSRNAEVLFFPLDEATATVRIECTVARGQTDQIIAQWDDGTEDNRVTWWRRGGWEGAIECEVVASGSPIAEHPHGTCERPDRLVLDFSFGGGSFRSRRGGVAEQTDSLTLPTGLDTLRIGANTTAVTGDLILHRVATVASFGDLSGATPWVTLPYGNLAGNWAGRRRWFERDISVYGGADYFCIKTHSGLNGGPAPDSDPSHWQPCPRTEYGTLLAQDTLLDNAGYLNIGTVNQRTAPSGQLWEISGNGIAAARVVDATGATSTDVTYFYLTVDAAIGRFEVDALEEAPGTLQTVMAVGGNGDDLSPADQMDHPVFTATGITDVYWYDEQSGVSYDSDGDGVFKWTRPLFAKADGEWASYAVERRGDFRFGFADGALVLIRCHPMITTLWDVARTVYLQHSDSGAETQTYRNFKLYGPA